MEHASAASRFSAGFGAFKVPTSKADKDRWSLIGAVTLGGVIVLMGISSRYIGFSDNDEKAAFLDDSSSRYVSTVPPRASSYRRESMDYLIPADDGPGEDEAAPKTLSDAVADQPRVETPAQALRQFKKQPARSQQRVLAIGFKGGSGLSGGIGKSFQQVFRQPLEEGSGQ